MMIPKREVEKFLKISILPLFGGGWFLHDGDTIVRMKGFLLQGIYFQRLTWGEVRPTYFIIVLPKAKDYIALTLGNEVKFKPERGWWPKFISFIEKSFIGRGTSFSASERFWTPDADDFAQQIFQLMEKQIKPKIYFDLDVESAIEYIESNHERKIFSVAWPLGILYGIAGNLKTAGEIFELAEEDLTNRLNGYREQNRSAPESISNELSSLNMWKDKLDNHQRFMRYCETETKRTKKALKLPAK